MDLFDIPYLTKYGFEVGEKSILFLYPIEPLDGLAKAINEISQGKKYKVDYSIPYQYEVVNKVRFKNGWSMYIKPKVCMSKMGKLMKKYLVDPNKLVPPMQMRID